MTEVLGMLTLFIEVCAGYGLLVGLARILNDRRS